MNVGPSLSRERIRGLLGELAEELRSRNVDADLFLVGGAAMALTYDSRRATADLDAAFRPSAEVRRAAAQVASRHDLPADWLNDGVKGFLPGDDPNPSIGFEHPSLRVTVASPEYLLAMKIAAARPEQDAEDIRVLYKHLGFSTAQEGLDLVERFYPPERLTPRVSYVLAMIVEPESPTPQREPETGGAPGTPRETTNRCRRCGRPLTNPESIARGVGPGCARRA